MKAMKNIIKKGDTLIEVAFSIAVFSLISVLSIQIMDRDLAAIQGTLEYEMARNEIDAQAEALRFIHNSYLSERELVQQDRKYMNLWLKLSRTNSSSSAGTGLANFPVDISQYSSVDCKIYYETNKGEQPHRIFDDKAFVINTRKLNPKETSETIIQAKNGSEDNKKQFTPAELYPRIIYTKNGSANPNDEAALAEAEVSTDNYTAQNQIDGVYDKIARAEGIWVISARQCIGGKTSCEDQVPEFYDFHIRTCWFAPGHERPSTVATTIRLYNPEYVEDQR